MTNNTTLHKVGLASVIMMASVFGSRVIGVLREMAIAGIGGVHASVDAYQIAFILPEILNHVVATGFLSITIIPILSAYLSAGQKQEGYRVFNLILNTFGVFLLILIILAEILTPELVHIFAPGIGHGDTFDLAVKMTRIILPAQFFFFCGGLFMAVQFANEKFLLPALAPLIYNGGIIAGGLIFGPIIGMEGFAWGVLFGAFAGNFALQLLGAKKQGAGYRFCFSLTHPDVIRYIKLTLPLMLGLTMTFSMEILPKFFGSFLVEGHIAALTYALRIMMILVGLFGQAVGVATYPFMAKLAQEKNFAQLNDLLNRTLKFIFLVIPFSCFFIINSREIVTVLFQRGQFDIEATLLTAGILPFFMAGAFAFSAQNLVSRGYYATSNTLFPSIVTSLCVLVFLPVIFWLSRIMDARGIALAMSVSMIFQSAVLYECWNKKSGNTARSSVYLFLLKLIPVSILITGILYSTASFFRMVFTPQSFWGAFMIAAGNGVIFLNLFFIAGYLFKIDEITFVFKNMQKRISPWKKK